MDVSPIYHKCVMCGCDVRVYFRVTVKEFYCERCFDELPPDPNSRAYQPITKRGRRIYHDKRTDEIYLIEDFDV